LFILDHNFDPETLEIWSKAQITRTQA